MKISGSLCALLAGGIALLGLGACAGSPAAKHAAPLRPLVSPASLGGDRIISQVVRGAFGARELTANCVVTVKDGTMTVIGMNSLGLRLFTVRYDGKDVQSEIAPGMKDEFMPERLLADLQLVFWPLASLEKPMREAGWQLSEPTSGLRRLRHGEQLVAEAHYASSDPWSGRTWFVNFEFGYSLQIDSQAM